MMPPRTILRKLALLICSIAAFAFFLSGCAGPPVLGRQVLGYDDVAKSLDEKLLLLNVARVDNGETVHFTSTSSIAATFDWTSTLGVGGEINSAPHTNFLNLNIGTSVSENPTFSIVPVSGQQFTKRVVTPFTDKAFEFLVFQGGSINQVMRIMAAGIEVQAKDGSFIRFIENDPRRPEEYEEFRRIAMHLQWLNNNRKLFVRPLVFEETLIADFRGVPSAADINSGFDKGLQWRQKLDGNYELKRLRAGRVIVTNFDPMAMTNEERLELNERIQTNPKGFVYLELRPDRPGGDLSIRGAIKLRSMLQILNFLANGIHTAKEFDVAPDSRTGEVPINPVATLKINVTDTQPENIPQWVYYRSRYYSVNNTHWDRESFFTLGILFQTTVGKIEGVGVPITISK
jgi:hypothetical protein